MTEQSSPEESGVMYLCSGYEDCPSSKCHHKKPHICSDPDARFCESYEHGNTWLLGCREVKNGKVSVFEMKTCPHCGHPKRVQKWKDIAASVL